MKVLEAKNCFFDYHRVNSKRNTIRNYDTVRNYELLLFKFCDQCGHREQESITSEEVLEILFAWSFFCFFSFSSLEHRDQRHGLLRPMD